MLEHIVDQRLLPREDEFIATQSQQALIRFVLGIIFTLYIAFHGPYFDRILPILAVSIPAYLALNLYCLVWIRRRPYSQLRLMLIPAVDNYLIVLAMWADGGHMSVAYVLLMSPIVGNGFRYGAGMVRYCQVLALISMAAISLITTFHLGLDVDWLGLAAELLGIFYISGYAYSILRKNEATLQARLEAEASASRLIAKNPHPAFTFDPEKPGIPILYANPAMASLVSARPEHLVGKPVDSIVIIEDRKSLIDAMLNLHPEKVRTCYVRLPGVLDRPIQVKCEISSVVQEGRHLGLCYMTDISESERLQHELAEAQKLAYAAALASGIAHDFRNVLAGIIGQAELIEMEHDDPQIREDARHIIEAGERGSSMVNQLLELGRSDSSEYKVLDISGALSHMLQIARVQLPPDIDLKIDIQPNLPKVRANLAQLEQVLLNLISNAAQAMPENRGEITVSLAPCSEPDTGKGLKLIVRDNGCGIPEEHLQHIFKPFWSTRKESGGTGLGMAMVQRIVRWHGGSIEVESEPGQGTSVIICLPAALESEAEAAAGEKEATPVPLDNKAVRPWNILLVEDQPEVMRIHKAFLSNMGHRIVTASDGAEALAIFRQHGAGGFDMVISDYMMPNMDGVQLARAIRETDARIPITMITAFGEDQALKGLKELNVQILAKPVSYHRLVTHLLLLQAERQAREARNGR